MIPHSDLKNPGPFLVVVVLALAPHPRPALATIDLVQPGTVWVVSHTQPKPRQIRHFGFIIDDLQAS